MPPAWHRRPTPAARTHAVLGALVVAAACATCQRLWCACVNRQRRRQGWERRAGSFFGACLAGQLAALYGLAAGDARAVRAAHVVFTLAVWVGAWWLSDARDLQLVAALCAVALATRRAYGACLFGLARGSTAVDDPRYDALYAVPLGAALVGAMRGRAA